MKKDENLLVEVLRHDQLLVLSSIAALVIIAWSSLLTTELMMPHAWSISDFTAAFSMWAVMMIAMMLPSAAPMILIFSAVNRKRAHNEMQIVPTWIFTSGYILVWISFSFLAAGAQYVLHSFALLSSELAILNPALSSAVLIAAGMYQFTRVKNVCLKNCQTPMDFLAANWRE